MKILSISAALLSLALAAPAFAQSTSGDTDNGNMGNMGANPSPATSPSTNDTDDTKAAGQTGDLKSLLTTLVQDNQGEIAMGKLAEGNAKSKLVKDFAKKLISDHTAAAKKVEPIATAKGVDTKMTSMPADASDKMSKMQAVKGSEFDREFASMMIDDHQEALSLLDQIKTAAAGDKQLTTMCDQLHKTMEMHLESAKKLAKVVGSPRHDTRGTDTDKDNDKDNDSGTNTQPK